MSKMSKIFFWFFKNFKKRIPQMTFMGPLKHDKARDTLETLGAQDTQRIAK